MTMNIKENDITKLKQTLLELQKSGKISLAYLYGSFLKGSIHQRSDIDLAIFFNTTNENEISECIDSVLMSVDREIEILRLDDEDESPFIKQEALKGLPLIEPDLEILYDIIHTVLHETENIRFRRTPPSSQ